MTYGLSPSQVLQNFCIAQDLISYHPQPSALLVSCAASRFMAKKGRRSPAFQVSPPPHLCPISSGSPNTPRNKCLTLSACYVFRSRIHITLRYPPWRHCPPELRRPVQWLLQHGLCRTVLFQHLSDGMLAIGPRWANT